MSLLSVENLSIEYRSRRGVVRAVRQFVPRLPGRSRIPFRPSLPRAASIS